MVVELAAEPGDDHLLPNCEPGQIDPGLDVDEDRKLARTVVDEELEAEREIVLGRLGDRADGADEQPFGRLADFAVATGFGLTLGPAPWSLTSDGPVGTRISRPKLSASVPVTRAWRRGATSRSCGRLT